MKLSRIFHFEKVQQGSVLTYDSSRAPRKSCQTEEKEEVGLDILSSQSEQSRLGLHYLK